MNTMSVTVMVGLIEGRIVKCDVVKVERKGSGCIQLRAVVVTKMVVW